MYGYQRMPSRVSAIKWLGVLQLIHGILIFIITIVLFAVDFEENRDFPDVLGDIKFSLNVILGLILTLLAVGAGVAGSSMSRYEGLVHNLSTKNICMTLSVMNGFMAIFYMIFGGTVIFYDVDKGILGDLSDQSDSYKTAFGMVTITFILAFFDMIVAFMSVILCALWMPREYGEAPPVARPPINEEPYIIREERHPYRNYGNYYTRGMLPIKY